MHLLASGLGVVLSLAFMFAAGVMNWRYGQSLGRTDADQWIFAALAIGIDMAKMLLPFFCWWSFCHRRWIAGVLAAGALGGCVMLSIVGLAGYVDLNRAATTGTLLSKRDTDASVRSDLARAVDQRAGLGPVEPLDVVTHKLDVLKRDARWRTSKHCANIATAASREFCAGADEMESARRRSVAVARLDVEVAALRVKQSELAAYGEIDRGDPRAGIVARLTGWELLRVQTGLSLLLVGIVEFMSTFGVFISLNHGAIASSVAERRRKTGSSTNPAGQKPRPLPKPAPAKPMADTCQAEIARFAVECMEPRKGHRVEIGGLYPRYTKWCRDVDVKELPLEIFVATFEQLCERSGFPVRNEGTSRIAENLGAMEVSSRRKRLA